MNDAFETDDTIDSDQMHDLRNQLTVVKGVAQLLDRQVRRDDWQRDKIIARIARLQDEIAQLEQLIGSHVQETVGKQRDLLY